MNLLPCPFCGNAPRHAEHKAGFYTERVICDTCSFYLSPEVWAKRARRPFSDQLAQQVIDGQVKDIDRLTKLIQSERREREYVSKPDALRKWVSAYWSITKNMDLGKLADYDDELASNVRELRAEADRILNEPYISPSEGSK